MAFNDTMRLGRYSDLNNGAFGGTFQGGTAPPFYSTIDAALDAAKPTTSLRAHDAAQADPEVEQALMRLAPLAQPGVDVLNLDANFTKQAGEVVNILNQKYCGKFVITSGCRSPEHEADLRAHRGQPGYPKVVARGPSEHEYGVALDISFTGPRRLERKFYRDYQAAIKKVGLESGMGYNDKWHMCLPKEQYHRGVAERILTVVEDGIDYVTGRHHTRYSRHSRYYAKLNHENGNHEKNRYALQARPKRPTAFATNTVRRSPNPHPTHSAALG